MTDVNTEFLSVEEGPGDVKMLFQGTTYTGICTSNHTLLADIVNAYNSRAIAAIANAEAQKQTTLEGLLETVPEEYHVSLFENDNDWSCGLSLKNGDPFTDDFDSYGQGPTPSAAVQSAISMVNAAIGGKS